MIDVAMSRRDHSLHAILVPVDLSPGLLKSVLNYILCSPLRIILPDHQKVFCKISHHFPFQIF